MAVKLLCVLVLAAVVSEGHAITQITLADESYTFITNQLIGKALTIPKLFLDTLQSCHVIFPNNVMYEAFPNNQLPAGNIEFLTAAQPFTSCAIGFRGADVSMSGTYELRSLVYHTLDSSMSLTRQRFHLTLVESNPWNDVQVMPETEEITNVV